MEHDTVIEARSLGKRYTLGGRPSAFASLWSRIRGEAAQPEELWALQDVSFDIRRGEVVGLIGRNGAGKSTLLKILSRITEPSAGQAALRGRVGSLLEVGTGFHPELTGRENVYLNGSMLGMRRSEIQRKFDEIVAFAEVDRFIDTPVKRYSSGMYVRLAFAVAAHLEPQILLVDEVLAVGDAAFQRKCLGRMSQVAHEGRTVLFVSHNMAAVSNLCTRALLFQQGQLVHDGPVDEAVERYVHAQRDDASQPLTQRTDRRGCGDTRFTAVRFEDARGRAVCEAVAGDPLHIVLTYRSRSPRPLQRPRFSIEFVDGFGQHRVHCSSELTERGIAMQNLPADGEVHCVIPRMPFSQNRLTLDLFMEANGEIQDWVKSAAVLDTVDGDFFGTGRVCSENGQGVGVLVEHDWTPGRVAAAIAA